MEKIQRIDHFNLWSFDLNLLVAFDALMQERSVTKAAARLRLQQPAMSHKLATLRLLTDDELFVRVGHDMKPTPHAHAFAEQIKPILKQISSAILSKAEFKPDIDHHTFRIGFSSDVEIVMGPNLVSYINNCAPNMKIFGRAAPPNEVYSMLNEGEIDIAIGAYDNVEGRHRSEVLYQRELVCCYNPKLLDIQAPISQDNYLSIPHAFVSKNSAFKGCLENALIKIDAELNIVMSAPEILTVLATVAQAPYIATLPATVTAEYTEMFGLATSPIPLNLVVPPISMLWPSHLEQDAATDWLRNKVRSLQSQGI